MRRLIYLVLFIMVSVAPSAFADDKPKEEPLPPPRRIDPAPQPAPATAPAPVYVVPYAPVSAYAVWDYYAVDRSGYFKPRVIATPYGAFYPLTGKPYPWTTTNMRNYMPYATD